MLLLIMKRIVVIGGGFGGVYTIKYLLKHLKDRKDVSVTLLSRDNYFLFTPMLHEVATGGLNRYDVVEPLRDIFNAKNFDFVKCEVKMINFDKKQIETSLCEIPYDYVIVALGSKTNFFDVPGAQEHCLDLKDMTAAAAVRNRIINSLEIASKFYKMKDVQSYLNFVVVGGGPTGVELSAEIAEFVRQMLRNNYRHLGNHFNVYLLQRGEMIIPFIHPNIREKALGELKKKGVTALLHAEVTNVMDDCVEINGKEKIPSHTIVWTSGVKPNAVETHPKIADERGYFHVNSYLQIDGMKNAFALGDCALFFNKGEKKPVPALAQTATIQARIVARNVLHLLNREQLEECHVKLTGLLVSVGQKYAVADLCGIRFSGFLAWWLWRTIYLFKLFGRANKFRVAIDWTINLFSKRDTSQI